MTALSPAKVHRLRRAGIRRRRGHLTCTHSAGQARRMALRYLALADATAPLPAAPME